MFTNEAAVEKGEFVAFLKRIVAMNTGEAFDMVDVGLASHNHFVGRNMLATVGTSTSGSEHSERGEGVF